MVVIVFPSPISSANILPWLLMCCSNNHYRAVFWWAIKQLYIIWEASKVCLIFGVSSSYQQSTSMFNYTKSFFTSSSSASFSICCWTSSVLINSSIWHSPASGSSTSNCWSIAFNLLFNLSYCRVRVSSFYLNFFSISDI